MERKWRMFRFRLFYIDMPLIMAAIVGIFFSKQDIAAILGIALGELALNYGTYFTANVAQKKVISEHYRPELAGHEDAK